MQTMTTNPRFNPYRPVHVFTAEVDGDAVAVALNFYGKSAEFLIPLHKKNKATEDFDRLRVMLKDVAMRMCAPDPGPEPGQSDRETARGLMTDHLQWFLQNFEPPEAPLMDDIDSNHDCKMRIQLLWYMFSAKLQFTMIQCESGFPLMVKIERTTKSKTLEFSDLGLDEDAKADSSIDLYFTSKLWLESTQLQPHVLTGQVHNLVKVYRGNIPPSTKEDIKDSGTLFCVRDIRPTAGAREHHRRIVREIHELRHIKNASRDNWDHEDYGPCVPDIKGFICHAMSRGTSMEMTNVLVGAVLEDILGPRNLDDVLADERTPRQLRCLHLRVMYETLLWLHKNQLVWGGSVDFPDEKKMQKLFHATVVDKAGRPWIMNGYREYDERTLQSDLFLLGKLRTMLHNLK